MASNLPPHSQIECIEQAFDVESPFLTGNELKEIEMSYPIMSPKEKLAAFTTWWKETHR